MISCISNFPKSITSWILLGELTPAFPTSILTFFPSAFFTDTPDSPNIATSVSSLVALDPQKPLIWTGWTDRWPGPVYVRLQGIESTHPKTGGLNLKITFNCSSPECISHMGSCLNWKRKSISNSGKQHVIPGLPHWPQKNPIWLITMGFHGGHYWTRIVRQ